MANAWRLIQTPNLHLYSNVFVRLDLPALPALKMGGAQLTCRLEEACFGHGTCVNLHCKCDEGFAGNFCELRSCPNDCSGHGACNSTHTGTCECGAGYGGEDCSQKLTCKADCSQHGSCWEDTKGEAPPPYDGVCHCDVPFTGEACENLPCPSGLEEGTNDAGKPKTCNGRGKCDLKEGICHCQRGYSGPACEAACPNKCGGHGVLFQCCGSCLSVTVSQVGEALAA